MAGDFPRTGWTIEDSSRLYRLEGWGTGHFQINELGHLVVHPLGSNDAGIDLKKMVDGVLDRGIGLPLLLRFSDILHSQIESIHGAFQRAIEEYGYQSQFRGVYPIKVNQDRYIVENLADFGAKYHFGLEAGSKPELIAVLAMLRDDEALIVCNGYKDREYIDTALLGSKLGRHIVIVLEKPSEVGLVLDCAARTGVLPRLGIRARLTSRGSGHWEASGGERSKFGFGSREILDALELLEEHDLLHCLELLHFHIGSQISSIRAVKEALREAARIYVSLRQLGAPMGFLDVGGGLGVDYDGTQTDFSSSRNYTLQEYANDIVAGVMEVCDPPQVEHPVLITESGRATVAHHAVLVVDVLGSRHQAAAAEPEAPTATSPPSLQYLAEAVEQIAPDNLLESFHDITAYRDDCLNLFKLGHFTLEQRASAEDIFWSGCRRIQHLLSGREVPEELQPLEAELAEIYYCNFSLFQSIPDSWAIDQLFPIMPLQRLAEKPTQRAVLADMTCDSDGRIDRFIGESETKPVLELHALDERPYYLGIFLVGAYQEILGDLHNLFGDTNTVNVSLDPNGGYNLDEVVPGNSVTDVLEYVRYPRDELLANLRRRTERAIRAGIMTAEESRHLMQIYEAGLAGYTYPEQD